ncbi:unnamed protein product [marine sediment metagenome]|uniref:Uncharacterized protein n=1 Tax=marine sediment metagenome TaxID=412755 RepID=X1PZ59_9ZZZZ
MEGPDLVGRKMDISRDLFGRGYDYKLSLGGLVSGTRIAKAPKGKLAGLGIRYPVRSGKKKGRGDVRLSDLLGG